MCTLSIAEPNLTYYVSHVLVHHLFCKTCSCFVSIIYYIMYAFRESEITQVNTYNSPSYDHKVAPYTMPWESKAYDQLGPVIDIDEVSSRLVQ